MLTSLDIDDDSRIYVGDVIDVLKQLPAESIHMCVTSPPYWGLRDYGTGKWEGGDLNCDHVKFDRKDKGNGGKGSTLNCIKSGKNPPPYHEEDRAKTYYSNVCGKCGAKRIDSQLGAEPSPDCGTQGQAQCGQCFVCAMVKVFREVKRVLRDDAVLWLNLGDTYASGGKLDKRDDWDEDIGHGSPFGRKRTASLGNTKGVKSGLPSGNLIGVPWRVALALQADGWVLRQDIIWSKPNAMPESVRNRCSKAHEYIFLLTKKGSGYFYDQYEIRSDGANKRSVWSVILEALHDEHFAAFPTELVKICISAGSSRKGCCPKCLAPWAEQFERERKPTRPGKTSKVLSVKDQQDKGLVVGNRDPERHVTTTKSVGWKPTCDCGLEKTIPCTILDIFSGSGTSGLVALRLHRRYIGIELNPKYAQNSLKRIRTNGKAGLDAKDSKKRNLFNGMD